MVDFSWNGPQYCKRRSKAAAGIGQILMSLAKRAFNGPRSRDGTAANAGARARAEYKNKSNIAPGSVPCAYCSGGAALYDPIQAS